MIEMFQALLWPLLTCVLLPPLLVHFGLQSARRNKLFLNAALPQAAALGSAIAILAGRTEGSTPFLLSFACAAVCGIASSFLRRAPSDSPAAVLYLLCGATGILLLSRSSDGAEQFYNLTVGDLLLVNEKRVLHAGGLFLGLAAAALLFRKEFEKDEGAIWKGLSSILFALAVASFFRIAGVLLTTAVLIGPALCGTLLAKSPLRQLIVGSAFAALCGVAGLYLTYKLDLPAGPTMGGLLAALSLPIILARRFRPTEVPPSA